MPQPSRLSLLLAVAAATFLAAACGEPRPRTAADSQAAHIAEVIAAGTDAEPVMSALLAEVVAKLGQHFDQTVLFGDGVRQHINDVVQTGFNDGRHQVRRDEWVRLNSDHATRPKSAQLVRH
jgi:hypothetical protein